LTITEKSIFNNETIKPKEIDYITPLTPTGINSGDKIKIDKINEIMIKYKNIRESEHDLK
jgi:hypothetical protein